jgi:hypothetical protein
LRFCAIEEDMEGETHNPDKTIEIAHANEQAKRTTGHLPPRGPDASSDAMTSDAMTSKDQEPGAKKTSKL